MMEPRSVPGAGDIVGKRAASRGFSLVELLIVIAIIAILLSLLYPLMRAANTRAMMVVCQSHMGTLAGTWHQYAMDHDGTLTSAENRVENNQPPWVAGTSSTNYVSQAAAIKAGSFWTYLRDLDVYDCPRSVNPWLLAYSFNGRMNGIDSRSPPDIPSPRTVGRYSGTRGFLRISELSDPGRLAILFEENDLRSWLVNSFVIDPRNSEWVDRVAGNHGGRDNIVFADGHTAQRRWEDPRTLQHPGIHFFVTPDNADMDFMRTIY